MAKKKKQYRDKGSRTPKISQGAESSRYEEVVRRTYDLYLREVKRNRPESTRLLESMDYDHARIKRRIAATVGSMEEVRDRVCAFCPDIPGVFTVAECWAEINAIPSSAFDLEEEFKHGTLGAAIWMLDRIKDNGKLYELVRCLPVDADPYELKMPDVWDPCHSTDVLAGMLSLIQDRNEDCTGLEKQLRKEPGLVKRCYMDLYTTEKKHKQEVPSRSRFEAAISLIPENAIDTAVQRFMDKYWDFVTRYFRSFAILAQEDKRFQEEAERFHAKSESVMDRLQMISNEEAERMKRQSVQAAMVVPAFPCAVAVADEDRLLNMNLLSGRPDATQTIRQMLLEETALNEWEEKIEQKKNGLWEHLRQFPMKPESWFTERFGEEITEIWRGFEMEDPYEICFAYLYLLDSGSDIPWLYLPSNSVLSMAMDALPWVQTAFRDDIPGIWYHVDPQSGGICHGPAQVALPKRIKVPELENWYRMRYMDRDEDDPEYQERINLAQVIYGITGCIMPRNQLRFFPALMELDRFGITGKRNLHPLVYAMSVLGEARRQSRTLPEIGGSWLDTEPENAQETDSVEDLKAEIAALKREVGLFRKAAYENGRDLREAKKAAEAQEEKAALERQELADLRELVFHIREDVYEDEPAAESMAFPYHNTQRIVVFGGHDSWAREIKPRLPDVRFVDRGMIPNAEMIRRADIVWVQANAISHAYYYKILEETRKHNIPVRYFTYASALKCAQQLAEQDMKVS